MISLEQLQEHFYAAIFEHGSDNHTTSKLGHYINETEGLSSIDHFNIYKGSITASLNRTLREIYPVCNRLTGDNFFNAMGKEYMRNTPSRSADLANYGEDFQSFIANFKHTENLPYLPDVARLEWAWHRAFNAADESGIDLAALGKVSEADKPHIVFYLPTSASLIASEFPIHHIWQVNQPDFKGDDQVDLDEGGIKLLVWREDYTMRIDPLDDVEWSILNEIETGNTFDTVCSHLCRHDPAPDIENILPALVQRGWIASFLIED
ncbi:MAG: putative DNA-binding domain-containing protein [Gammaproteobacteria bacterium]|nr:putative DNA-binding domain-containing protein [Gammaproteobacteria bacterium]MCK5668854.1 putative DNA-binding domain-containing protein [Gammaproteobacteria bacterium]